MGAARLFVLVITAVLVFEGHRPLVEGQSTDNNPKACTYSFVVPQTDILSTCQRFSSQQVDAMQKKIDVLEQKVRLMSSAGQGSSSMSKYFNTSFSLLNPTFTCSCQNKTTFSFAYRDCQDVKIAKNGVSGVYKVSPIKETSQLIAVESDGKDTNNRYWVAKVWDPVLVFCDLAGEMGWTVIMRRTATYQFSFNRTWNEYKHGFGNMTESSDFWLGLDKIHRITSQRYASYGLWIVVTTDMGVPHVIPYTTFEIASEEMGYKLKVSGWHGSGSSYSSDYMTRGNGRFFVAWDKDGNTSDWRAADTTSSSTYNRYYRDPRVCTKGGQGGKTAGGGWWFYEFWGKYYSTYSSTTFNSECGSINLNAEKPYHAGFKEIKAVEMKIRPMD